MTTTTTTTTTVADNADPQTNMFPNHLDIANNPNPQEPVTAELPHKHYVKRPGSLTNFRMSHFTDPLPFHRAHLNLNYHRQVRQYYVQNRHTYFLPSNNTNPQEPVNTHPQELEGEDDQSEMEEID